MDFTRLTLVRVLWPVILTTLLLLSAVCDGTNVALITSMNHTVHIRNLKRRYENCTYVQGNLEITHINQDDDLAFLGQIREVTGYVLIAKVDRAFLPLPSLRVIRGRTLYVKEEMSYALFVAANIGLRELGLVSLQEIMRGDVAFIDNPRLCHVDGTVDWHDILYNNITQRVSVDNSADMRMEKTCAKCSSLCDADFCWGVSASTCQKRSKSTCASQCRPGRCYDSGATECCHRECAAGCFGPEANQCLACKVFEYEGVCVQSCPSARDYDQETMTWKTKEGAKLAFGNTCVAKCPTHMLEDEGACVRECPEDKVVNNGTCVRCDGPCPKVCRGFNKNGKKHEINFITETTIRNLINCTIIEGNLVILSMTFKGIMEFSDDKTVEQRWHDGVTPADLEQLSTIKEITGYFRIDASHSDMSSLSFLRNLEYIRGRTVEEKYALTVSSNSYLTSLGLDSLKKVEGGGIRIVENRQLCFADTVDWTNSTIADPKFPVILKHNQRNEICKEAGEVCHSDCSADGCWGKEPSQCVSCANFKYGKHCIRSCRDRPNLFNASSNTCEACHAQCLDGCSGPGAENCTKCLNVKDDGVCKSTCPLYKYRDDLGTCQQCNPVCQGCSGKGTFVGQGGCRSCEVAKFRNDSSGVLDCIQDTSACSGRHYMQHYMPGLVADRMDAMAGKLLCRPCHSLCESCQSDGFYCDRCVHFKEDDKCVRNCSLRPFNTFFQAVAVFFVLFFA